MKNKKEYVITYDLLNIAACIAVVALHVNTIFWTFSYDPYWTSSLITETVFYWAVPVFFMLSGAKLIDYRNSYDTSTFLKRRFSKTLISYLFWSSVSIIWAIYVVERMNVDEVSTWKGLINAIINHKGISIYWFFPHLFALYLCIPVLSMIPEEKRKKVFLYMIIYAFISFSLLPTLAPFIGIWMPDALHSPLNGGGYVIFLLLGYYITHYPITKFIRVIIYVLGFYGWAIRYFYTRDQSLILGYID